VEAASVPADAAPGECEGRELKRAISRNMLLFFVVGDVLGAGIYALVREVGGRVGGAIWAAFARALAFFTAVAYAELVTKYPRAAGAALYVNKAFGVSFVTFMVAFAVMASGLTSASTLARAFGGDYLAEFVSVPTVAVAAPRTKPDRAPEARSSRAIIGRLGRLERRPVRDGVADVDVDRALERCAHRTTLVASAAARITPFASPDEPRSSS
jgi:hypothetical protein